MEPNALIKKQIEKEKNFKSARKRDLTLEQIKHWRNTLFATFGPYAFIMPEAEVYDFKEKIEQELKNVYGED